MQITREYLYSFDRKTATRSRVRVSAALARSARPAAPHPLPRRPLHHPIRRRQPDHDPRRPASSNSPPARNSNRHSRLARTRLTLPSRRLGTPHRATAQQRAAQTGVNSTIPPARAVAPTATRFTRAHHRSMPPPTESRPIEKLRSRAHRCPLAQFVFRARDVWPRGGWGGLPPGYSPSRDCVFL